MSLTLKRTIFVTGKPENDDARYRGGLYEFKRDDPEDDMVYYCNGDEAQVRKLVNAILDKVNDPEILKLIYEYGEARIDAARGDWYENDAGTSL